VRTFELHSSVTLPRPLDEVFPFFSDARNLERLTPPWLRFSVLTPGPIEMRPGATIDYRLRLRGVPLRWRSEITVWEPPGRFVDEQRRGPYRLWSHEHCFEAVDGRTLAHDHVRYAVPGGWLADRLLVRRDLQRVFEYRRAVLRDLFGTVPDAAV
jgi:ligand-binding SRPBCC domain-containing protein